VVWIPPRIDIPIFIISFKHREFLAPQETGGKFDLEFLEISE